MRAFMHRLIVIVSLGLGLGLGSGVGLCGSAAAQTALQMASAGGAPAAGPPP
ncbi:hypothetical protein AcdelDRAFT_2988, partial [Acidovorax delafieldii 2AN]